MRNYLKKLNLWQLKRNSLPIIDDPQLDWAEMEAILDREMPQKDSDKLFLLPPPKKLNLLSLMLVSFSAAAMTLVVTHAVKTHQIYQNKHHPIQQKKHYNFFKTDSNQNRMINNCVTLDKLALNSYLFIHSTEAKGNVKAENLTDFLKVYNSGSPLTSNRQLKTDTAQGKNLKPAAIDSKEITNPNFNNNKLRINNSLPLFSNTIIDFAPKNPSGLKSNKQSLITKSSADSLLKPTKNTINITQRLAVNNWVSPIKNKEKIKEKSSLPVKKAIPNQDSTLTFFNLKSSNTHKDTVIGKKKRIEKVNIESRKTQNSAVSIIQTNKKKTARKKRSTVENKKTNKGYLTNKLDQIDGASLEESTYLTGRNRNKIIKTYRQDKLVFYKSKPFIIDTAKLKPIGKIVRLNIKEDDFDNKKLQTKIKIWKIFKLVDYGLLVGLNNPDSYYAYNQGSNIYATPPVSPFFGIYTNYKLYNKWTISAQMKFMVPRNTKVEYQFPNVILPDSIKFLKDVNSKKIYTIDLPIHVVYNLTNQISLFAGPTLILPVMVIDVNDQVSSVSYDNQKLNYYSFSAPGPDKYLSGKPTYGLSAGGNYKIGRYNFGIVLDRSLTGIENGSNYGSSNTILSSFQFSFGISLKKPSNN